MIIIYCGFVLNSLKKKKKQADTGYEGLDDATSGEGR